MDAMIDLPTILKQYPDNLQGFPKFILREYLQYKILQILFESEYASNFCFLGGTCLRLIHGNSRFSEDLDFDNFNITPAAFDEVAATIAKELAKEGYEVEISTLQKGAYHCKVRFPELLYSQGLSSYREEKILIQLDTEAQDFVFKPEKVILNKFDVFTQIYTTPLPLLLAQKIYAIINRKRNKGRDFFDVVFLLSLVKAPNYTYLEQKLNITTPAQLKETILQKCTSLNMQEMAKDVEPFLFNASDVKKVLLFADLIKQEQL
jgi:predicted nucleotidyltransferase component of viral defense system